MRVYFEDGEKARSGLNRNSNMVYKARRNKTITIMRRHFIPRMTEQRLLAGQKFKAVVALWKHVGVEFKKELNEYAKLYVKQILPQGKVELSGYNIFIKALCKLDLDLTSLATVTFDLGSTLDHWIGNNALPTLKNRPNFTAKVDE